MSDIYLCSFASPSLDLSVKRFEKEAINICENSYQYINKGENYFVTNKDQNYVNLFVRRSFANHLFDWINDYASKL